MSFNVTYPPMKKADAAHAVRSGDHHRKGLHTQLDKMREPIAEMIEQTGQDGDTVRVSVAGHHDDQSHTITISVQVMPSDLPEREEEL